MTAVHSEMVMSDRRTRTRSSMSCTSVAPSTAHGSTVPQAPDDEQLLTLVERLEIDGAPVEEDRIPIARRHFGSGRSTTR